ncbi:hypothetical protein A1O3_02434 [Capronia epimyces CBS 606.96]|uniref:Tyrosine decarboxylase n=1 Tax=Capronia epimyces CBS 606.96 TaxID=1182542 RepID=W9Y972_9EURO|nr:uncharacterized protein A1O3_02434 [Capronia epimyces CBS 606.96]EXJ89367.1 hypothetical protein A1O3_02434 [Capronia epimyces CBS 606.96]
MDNNNTTNTTTTVTPIPNNSLTHTITTLQSILSTTNLDQDRRTLPIIPASVPGLTQLQAHILGTPTQTQAARLTGSGTGSSSESESDSSSGSDSDSDALSRLATHLAHDILPYLNLASLSPNYYGFVTGGATPAALLGDFLASVYDQNVQVHLPRDTAATALEVAALNRLVRLFRLPEAEWAIGGAGPGGGTFTTGATASNVLGLALGREYVLRRALERKTKAGLSAGAEAESSSPDESFSCGDYGIAELMVQAGVRRIQVLSTLSHSSMAKAASVVGIGRRNVVSILAAHNDNDNDTSLNPLQIDIDRLETEARKSKQDGGVLSILTLSAGEVNTGRFATDSYDAMVRVRRICDEYGVWIHVDGAFGLFGRLFDPEEEKINKEEHEEPNKKEHEDEYPGYREITRAVQGLELADSITADCHKLLNVPYDCGVFFTRHKALSELVFGNGNAAYLTSGANNNGGSGGDGGDRIQSPLNIGLENSRRFRALPVYCTLAAYGREGHLDMLKRQIALARRVTKWLLQDARFEAKNADFVTNVNATRHIYLTGTVWRGKPAARIAVSNWQVDVERDANIIQDVLHRAVGES